MGITASAQGGVQVLKIDSDLVQGTAVQFRRAAENLLHRDEREYVVDLCGVTEIDSAGLEALTWLQRQCEERLGSIKLCHLHPTLSAILRLTRLSERFESFSSTTAAVESFGY